jgi:hypothetical protein
MGVKYRQRYCPNDREMVLAVKNTPNHILHVVLTIVTLGLWSVVWIVVTVLALGRPYRCQKCGTPTVEAASSSAVTAR